MVVGPSERVPSGNSNPPHSLTSERRIRWGRLSIRLFWLPELSNLREGGVTIAERERETDQGTGDPSEEGFEVLGVETSDG